MKVVHPCHLPSFLGLISYFIVVLWFHRGHIVDSCSASSYFHEIRQIKTYIMACLIPSYDAGVAMRINYIFSILKFKIAAALNFNEPRSPESR